MGMACKQVFKSHNQTSLEKVLTDLINDGVKHFDGYAISPTHIGRKTNIALASFAAASASAKLILLGSNSFNPEPSFGVLRSIQEAYIKLAFILQANDDSRLLALVLEDASDEIKRLKLLDSYAASHSQDAKFMTDLSGIKGKVKLLEQVRDESQEELKRILGPHDLTPDTSSLVNIAKQYDETALTRGAEPSMELGYRLVYFHLSQFTHMSMSILAAYMEETQNNISQSPSEPVHGCEMVLHSAYCLLAEILVLALNQVGIQSADILNDAISVSKKFRPTPLSR
jgi:Family of unknown function (DUF5677)